MNCLLMFCLTDALFEQLTDMNNGDYLCQLKSFLCPEDVKKAKARKTMD